MEKKLKVEEVMMLDSILGNIIGRGIPVLKTELLEVKTQLGEVVEDTLNKKQDAIDKYITRDEEGKGILKEGIDAAKELMVTDFESSDEEAMVEAIKAITEEEVEINFPTVSKDEEVLVKVNGEYTTFTIQRFLEKSTEVDSRVLGILTEFFIND